MKEKYMINEEGIVYLDENVRDYFCGDEKPMTLYRYMDCKYLKENRLRFLSPAKWNDPYERLFLNSKYLLHKEEIECPLKNRVFCICFTRASSSEAAWKVYRKTTKFSLRTGDFLNLLKLYTEDYKIYIGEVSYKSQTSFVRDSIRKLTGLTSNDFLQSNEEAWVKLLLLKRAAFEYEKEIRVILISKKNIETQKDAIYLDFPVPIKDLFHHVELAPILPDFIKDYNPTVVYDELIELGFEPNQISESSLFKDVKPRHLRIFKTLE
jgi:hypothetical protein